MAPTTEAAVAVAMVTVTFAHRVNVSWPFYSHTEAALKDNPETGRPEAVPNKVQMNTGPAWKDRAESDKTWFTPGESIEVPAPFAAILEMAGHVGSGVMPGFTVLDPVTGEVKRSPYTPENPMPRATQDALRAKLEETDLDTADREQIEFALSRANG